MYSTGCVIARNQGISVVLNLFYGTLVNSAYGISQQVSGAVQFLSTSILNAMNPQIMKAEGAGERQKMLHLCELASKYSFLLLSLVAIPLVAEMDTILQLWLGNVPEHAVMFCQFILVAAMCDQISIGLTSANQAIGELRTYNIVFYTLKLFVVVIGWICLKCDLPISSIMWSYVVIEMLTSLLRLPLMKHIADIDISRFCKNVFLRVAIPCLTMIVACYLSITYLVLSWRVLITFAFAASMGVLTIWAFALSDKEKQYIKTWFTNLRK